MTRGILLAVALAAASFASAQTSPDQQARGLLDDGRTYLKEGKLKQALDNFNTIVSGFSATDSVDDALLEIGRYQMEVEKNPDKAREAFEQVAKRFPQSDGAPGAYFYLGMLTLARTAAAAEIEDALAQFARVQRLYPGSEWVPKALYASATAHRKAGRFQEAVEAGRRVFLEYPNSDAAPAAHFEVGHVLALMGEPRPAMEEYQQIRNRFRGSEWAPRALDRITALYRLYGSPKPSFAADSSYSIGAGDILKDVRALLMTPAGTLWIASDKVKSVVPYGAEGKMGASVPGVDLGSLALAPGGDLLASARLGVRVGPRDIRSFAIPTDKPGVPEPLERIQAAVMTPAGSMLVADGKKKHIYRFDPRQQYQGLFPDGNERDVTRMTVDGEGGIVVLDQGTRSVQVFDESGRLLRSIPTRGAGYELHRPVDVAVDPCRNLYLADREAGILVFSPQGQLLIALSGPELRRPTALTLDPSGAVLVYDEKAERVLRYK
ncbi:MAG TPA: tetratricopeptide repeat protein [Vicinamibacteria bacterium]|nr:tetratricopeptide repeat protein [Vicinamibacteria bacterium]